LASQKKKKNLNKKAILIVQLIFYLVFTQCW